MFGVRRCGCATAILLAQLAFVTGAHASDLPSTVIVSSNTSDARLSRALVLIRGELSALGLEVQVRVAEAEAARSAPETRSERLNLDVKEGVIVVRVFAAGTSAPLLESVDLDGPDVTAEVIAVRAVEALRAARLLPSRAQRVVAPKPGAEQPRAEPLAEPPSAEQAAKEPAPADDPAAERPAAQQRPAEQSPAEQPVKATPTVLPVPLVQLWLGPTFVQNSQGLPQVSAHAAVLVGPHWGFVALGAEGSLSTPQFERRAGSAQVSRRRLFLQLGARVRVHRAWELSARGGVSYIHYSATGAAQSGYLDQELSHSTGGASLSLGGAYYFVRSFGVYLDFDGLIAFDAAQLRLGDEDAVTLDRPSLAIGAGVLVGAF